MNEIHKVSNKPWISPNRVNIQNLVEQKSRQLSENNITLDGSDSPEEEFKHLKDKLTEFIAQDEEQVRPYFLFNSTDERVLTQEPSCKLKMYQAQLEHAKRMISDRSYKVSYLSRLNTTRRETIMRHSVLTNRQDKSDKSDKLDANNLIDNDEDCKVPVSVLVVVQVWPQPQKNEKLKLETEILFRSDQSLTELRDQLKCHRDFGNPMDLSDNPDRQTDRIFRGDLFKSGMFLIENSFYNDLRDANNTDMSDSIIRWASEEVTVVDKDNRNHRVSRGLGPFNRFEMEKSTFQDLNIRLGHPYLYMHQGNCEHLFCISDIIYRQNNRQLLSMKFPFVVAPACGRKEDALKCYMCKIGPPHWYTRNNSRLPVDPFFFCENCFKSFNYDSSKKKIGNFEAYLWNWPGQIAS